MKRVILIFGISLLSITTTLAQRLAYVDSDYILKQMPEYASAKRQIDALSAQWQKEVDDRYQEIDRLLKAYQADEILLSADVKKRREAEIDDKQKTARDFQVKKFGPDGELTQRSNSIVKPIQDKITKAIQAVGESEDLDMIFDKNSEVIMLYFNPRYDKSNDVIKKLGLKPATTTK
jgi:outer membrane protein